MKKIILISLMLLSLNALKSQDYYSSIGIRTGWYNGVTLKHFIGEPTALEGILAIDYLGTDFSLTGLYELQYHAFDVDGLRWFCGVGGGIGSVTKNTPFSLSVDGIIGMEYIFPTIPLNVSVDFKPYLTFFGNVGLFPDSGISARYIFN